MAADRQEARSAAQDQLGPPPIYHFKGNMEYAAPGTNEWARKAWSEIERLREQLNSGRTGRERAEGLPEGTLPRV